MSQPTDVLICLWLWLFPLSKDLDQELGALEDNLDRSKNHRKHWSRSSISTIRNTRGENVQLQKYLPNAHLYSRLLTSYWRSTGSLYFAASTWKISCPSLTSWGEVFALSRLFLPICQIGKDISGPRGRYSNMPVDWIKFGLYVYKASSRTRLEIYILFQKGII